MMQNQVCGKQGSTRETDWATNATARPNLIKKLPPRGINGHRPARDSIKIFALFHSGPGKFTLCRFFLCAYAKQKELTQQWSRLLLLGYLKAICSFVCKLFKFANHRSELTSVKNSFVLATLSPAGIRFCFNRWEKKEGKSFLRTGCRVAINKITIISYLVLSSLQCTRVESLNSWGIAKRLNFMCEKEPTSLRQRFSTTRARCVFVASEMEKTAAISFRSISS